MSEGTRPNIYTEEWQRAMEHQGFAVRGTRVGAAAGATQIGVSVYALDPGKKNLVVRFPILSSKAVAYMLSTEPQLDYFEGEPE